MKLVVRTLSIGLLSVLPWLASPAAATTFQMVEDSALADQARAVVRAKIVEVEPSTLGDRPATDYIIEVERVLKGDVPGSTLVVRVPGGIGPNGVGLKIWGAPQMAVGESTLLFLNPAQDGTFRVLHLMLGAFHRQAVQGKRLAIRDLSEAQEVRTDGIGPARDEVRDFDRFADWIADRASGVARDRDYLVAGEGGLRSAVDAFTLIRWDEDNLPVRWFLFDIGQSVAWRVHSAGQPGLGFDATAAAINVALKAWNDDGGSNIRYTYAGSTTASTAFARPDGVNAIIFEDPGDDASGTFECGSGGVIAVGGPWFSEETRVHGGEPYHESGEADIVANDGTECFFRDNPRAAEEVFAHELGHTLGLGHSATRDALMSARAHDDGRGARLHSDDRAAVAHLYGSDGGNPQGGPKAPSGLAAGAVTPTSVALSWKDNSKNETTFRLERKTGTGKFAEILTFPANTTQVTVSDLTPGISYSFRVRASNASGFSGYTDVVKVRTPTGGTLAAPANLKAVARTSQRVLLTWSDTSNGETGFRIERAVGGGAFQELATQATANATSILIRGLAPGTTYRFRVRAAGAGTARSPYSAVVSVTTPN